MNPDIEKSLAALQAEIGLKRKPFPLSSLLQLYEIGNRNKLYTEHFKGFKLLIHWLSPINIPLFELKPIPKLHQSYELNRIAELLNVHPSIIYQAYHGYETATTFILFTPDPSFLS